MTEKRKGYITFLENCIEEMNTNEDWGFDDLAQALENKFPNDMNEIIIELLSINPRYIRTIFDLEWRL
jgi:hypothetical protein